MPEVVWIGGGPATGKSTVAGRLARRYGLRLYAADARTWVHRDRALTSGDADARRWEELGPDGRWQRPTDELVAMSLHRARGPYVLDDVAALPEAPLVIAEGTTLPAADVDPDRAVWLVPTQDFQDAQLAARGIRPGPTRLYRALRDVIAAEAERAGLRTVRIDGSTGPDETIRAVEEILAGPLREGPHAGTDTERRELLAERNRAAIDQVRGFFTRHPGDPGDTVLDFACECGDPTCTRTVRTEIRDYRSPCRAEG